MSHQALKSILELGCINGVCRVRLLRLYILIISISDPIFTFRNEFSINYTKNGIIVKIWWFTNKWHQEVEPTLKMPPPSLTAVIHRKICGSLFSIVTKYIRHGPRDCQIQDYTYILIHVYILHIWIHVCACACIFKTCVLNPRFVSVMEGKGDELTWGINPHTASMLTSDRMLVCMRGHVCARVRATLACAFHPHPFSLNLSPWLVSLTPG